MFTFLERYLSRMSGKSMPVDLDHVKFKTFHGFLHGPQLYNQELNLKRTARSLQQWSQKVTAKPLPGIAKPRTAGLSAGAAWRQGPLKQNPINIKLINTLNLLGTSQSFTQHASQIQATQEHEMAWDDMRQDCHSSIVWFQLPVPNFPKCCRVRVGVPIWPPHPATTAATPFSLDSLTSFQQLHSQQRYTRPPTGLDSIVWNSFIRIRVCNVKVLLDLVLLLLPAFASSTQNEVLRAVLP